MAQTTTTLSAVFNTIKAIRGHRALLGNFLILRHGLRSREFYIDGASQKVYFVDEYGYPALLERQTEFVQKRVLDALSGISRREFNSNIRIENAHMDEIIDMREEAECAADWGERL